MSSRKAPFLVPDYNESWISFDIFSKISNDKFREKSVRWKMSCSIWTDGRTYITKLIIDFRNFEKAAKKKGDLVTEQLKKGKK